MKSIFQLLFFSFFFSAVLLLSSCSEDYDPCDFDKDGTIQSIEQKKCDIENAAVPIKPDRGGELPDNAEENEDINEYEENGKEQINEREEPISDGEVVFPTTAFISVHMEPGNRETPDWPEAYWPDLVDLITLADQYDIKLTLNFNPQWGTYILDDEERLALLRSWEENGHEIALHHHGPHHGNWNGYTNQEEYFGEPEYLGTVADMMSIMNQLPASGQILTAGIGGEEDIDSDWPEGVLYETDGGAEGIGDLLSVPTAHAYGGNSVVGLRHAGYTTATKVTLPEMLEAFETAEQGEIVGVVFHEHNYAENPDEIEKLFELFKTYEIEVKTAQQIMEEGD